LPSSKIMIVESIALIAGQVAHIGDVYI
jgi:hypothetical protein